MYDFYGENCTISLAALRKHNKSNDAQRKTQYNENISPPQIDLKVQILFFLYQETLALSSTKELF